jgi:hypothetical protein
MPHAACMGPVAQALKMAGAQVLETEKGAPDAKGRCLIVVCCRFGSFLGYKIGGSGRVG